MNRLVVLLFSLIPCFSFAQQQPPAFLENNGDVLSAETHKATEHVLYKLVSSTAEVYITRTGLSYVFHKILPDYDSLPGKPPVLHYEVERVDMNLVRASISKQQIKRAPLKLNTSIRQYRSISDDSEMVMTDRVVFTNIYPNIDWVLYLKSDEKGNTSLKHDYIFHPGADTRKLRVRYSSNATIHRDAKGKLQIKSKLGTIEEAAPYVYEEYTKRNVSMSVGVNGQYVDYYFDDPIASKKIVLDPELYWGTFLTSPVGPIRYVDQLVATDVETDSKGNIFVLMNASPGIGFPTANPGNGAYYANLASTPEGSIQVAKFTPEGKLLWCTFFGKQMYGTVMGIDSEDNLYMLGRCSGTIPLKNNGGYFDGSVKQRFISKFSNAGELLWCSYMGAEFTGDYGFDASDITADKHGRIFITGTAYYYSMPFKDAGNGAYFFNTPDADKAIFIMAFDNKCKLLWSTQMGTGYYIADVPRICIDGNDNIFIVANPRYNTYPLKDAGGVAYYLDDANWNAAITSFNAQWQMTWSTILPGVPFGVRDVTTDRDNNIFVVGFSARLGFPTTDPGGGAFIDNVTNPGLATGFIMKFSPAKQLIWATRFANDRQILLQKVIADPTCDAIHITGVMNDGRYNGVPVMNGGCSDGFYFTSTTYTNGTGPIYLTFKSSGQQVYTSLSDVGYEYYGEFNDFDIDQQGNRLYLYGSIKNFETIPTFTQDPGNGAFFQEKRNNLWQASFLMKLRPSGVNASVSVGRNSCGCTKEATVQPLCGQAPFTYIWSSGETTQTASNLCMGRQSVRVFDAACRDTLIYFDVQPANEEISSIETTVGNVTCDGGNGSIAVTTVNGGNAPYTYSINNGTFQSSNVFGSLSPGKYIIKVKSSSACEWTDSATVEEVLPIESLRTTTTPVHCDKSDGSVTVSQVQGGAQPYRYSLDGINFSTQNVFDHLGKGFHYLYVRDNNGCTIKDSFMIAEASEMLAVSLQVTDALCGSAAGSIKVTGVTGGTGPYQYSLNDVNYQSNSSFYNVGPGNGVLYVKDAFGCVHTKEYRLKTTSSTPVKIKISDSSVCYGSSITFEANVEGQERGMEFSWNKGESSSAVMVKKITTNTLTILDVVNEDGCSSSDTITVTVKRCDSSFALCVIFPNAVTANGDGINDTFGPAILGCVLDSYILKIYNRYGELVFTTNDPGKNWSGVIAGKEPMNATFVYHCEYSINGTVFSKQGSFTIIR